MPFLCIKYPIPTMNVAVQCEWICSGAYRNDLHDFDPGMLRWSRITDSEASFPSERVLFGFASLDSRLYVFGGLGDSGEQACTCLIKARPFTCEFGWQVPKSWAICTNMTSPQRSGLNLLAAATCRAVDIASVSPLSAADCSFSEVTTVKVIPLAML